MLEEKSTKQDNVKMSVVADVGDDYSVLSDIIHGSSHKDSEELDTFHTVIPSAK